MRLVVTPSNGVFAVWHFENQTHEIWQSIYRIEGDLFHEQFIAEQIWRYKFENGLLIMESDQDKFVFKAVKRKETGGVE